MILFQDLVASFKDINILCVGDVLLDRYVMGEAHRLSPEAPVPVLHALGEKNKLGGAGNVIHNLSALGVSCFLCGLVGKDAAAKEVYSLLDELSACSYDLPGIDGWKTIEKIRFMAESKHMLRVDFEEKLPITTEAIVKLFEEKWRALLKKSNVLVLSDYGKGLLKAEVVKKIIQLAEKEGVPVIVDPKGTNFSKYAGASLITPNRNELSLAADGAPVGTIEECVKAANIVLDKVDVKGILVTRGADGMAYITREGLQKSFPARVHAVHDVSGAGDTVISMAGIGLALDWPMEKTMELATICAGKVVGKVGTAVIELQELEETLNDSSHQQIVPASKVAEKIKKWQERGLTVGFTNGCFDILHQGHLSLLDFAKSKCDKLIVGINTDQSVKRLKGKKRPIQGEKIRGTVLSSLSQVDGVVLFSEDTPQDLIKVLKPNVLIKGQDYKVSEVVGADFVLDQGGEVFLAPLLEGFSTTTSIEKIST